MPSTLARKTVHGLVSRISHRGTGETDGLATTKRFRPINQVAWDSKSVIFSLMVSNGTNTAWVSRAPRERFSACERIGARLLHQTSHPSPPSPGPPFTSCSWLHISIHWLHPRWGSWVFEEKEMHELFFSTHRKCRLLCLSSIGPLITPFSFPFPLVLSSLPPTFLLS